MKLSELKLNPNNPRFIRDEKFKKLVHSIKQDDKFTAEMMKLRPIVIDDNNMILAGNMRFRAFQDLGKIEIPDEWVKRASDMTEEQRQRFIVEDNLAFGETDFDVLANSFEVSDLLDWGFDEKELRIDLEAEEANQYSKDIQVPIYEPSSNKPELGELVDTEKSQELVDEIEKTNLSEEEKVFLIRASYRHNVFNYSKIADYYANSTAEVQALMEMSGLVIIDYKKAIENGYIKLSKEIGDLYGKDYETKE